MKVVKNNNHYPLIIDQIMYSSPTDQISGSLISVVRMLLSFGESSLPFPITQVLRRT